MQFVGEQRVHDGQRCGSGPGASPTRSEGRNHALRCYHSLDAAWLTAALDERHPGTVVESAEQANARRGAGTKLFLRLTYQRNPSGLPEHVVVKSGLVPRDPDEFTVVWEAMTRRLNAAEARFYRDFAGATGMEVPTCYHADIDEATGRSAVIMEDLAGCRFGAFDEPLGADAAATVLSDLARLHARYWADPILDGPTLADPLVEDHGMLHHFIAEANWAEQMSRPRAAGIPEPLHDRDRVVTAIHAMWALQFTPPLTALHGDPHIGNLYFRPDGTPGLLDWQVFSRGIWVTDVAYFLVGALDTGARRAHERDLLRHYLAELAAHGGPALSPDAAWTAYRQRMFHGFMNILTPADASQTEEYNAAMGGRFAAAIADLDSFGALGLPSIA
jgi:hypothetical protein